MGFTAKLTSATPSQKTWERTKGKYAGSSLRDHYMIAEVKEDGADRGIISLKCSRKPESPTYAIGTEFTFQLSKDQEGKPRTYTDDSGTETYSIWDVDVQTKGDGAVIYPDGVAGGQAAGGGLGGAPASGGLGSGGGLGGGGLGQTQNGAAQGAAPQPGRDKDYVMRLARCDRAMTGRVFKWLKEDFGDIDDAALIALASAKATSYKLGCETGNYPLDALEGWLFEENYAGASEKSAGEGEEAGGEEGRDSDIPF